MVKHPPQLADFEIVRRLGAGGMAEVFLAKKRGAEGTYKLLVVKRILPAHGASRRFRSMFVEEAQLATRLNHPNIVQVYEFSDHGDEGLLLSMEYVEGFDLGKLMTARQDQGRAHPAVRRGVHHRRGRQGPALRARAQGRGRRRRSPSSTATSRRRTSSSRYEGVVKIADFGIASANLFREEPGVLKGKFGYMSPEQARGEKVDRRSDIYALGVVFYELLTLRSPYGELDDDALLDAVQTGALRAAVARTPGRPAGARGHRDARARRTSRDDRFQTARDMAGAIARALLASRSWSTTPRSRRRCAPARARPAAAHGASRRRLAVRRSRRRWPPCRAARGQRRRARAPPARRASGAARSSREVRHVAVVTLRLAGPRASSSRAAARARRPSAAASSIRAMLGDIAYKRGAVWSWERRRSRGARRRSA